MIWVFQPYWEISFLTSEDTNSVLEFLFLNNVYFWFLFGVFFDVRLVDVELLSSRLINNWSDCLDLSIALGHNLAWLNIRSLYLILTIQLLRAVNTDWSFYRLSNTD